jgi:hypothetical protein
VFPFPFWKATATRRSQPSEQHYQQQLTTHQIKHKHTDPNSATYKVYIDPFDSAMPGQWLNFQMKLRIIIKGNGLNDNGPTPFNLTCALLKDDALQRFDERATKLSVKKDNYKVEKMDHILYLHSISNLPLWYVYHSLSIGAEG